MYAPQELASGLMGTATLASSVPCVSLWSSGTVQSKPSSSGSSGGGVGNGGSVYHAHFNLGSQGKYSQALLSAPQDVRPLNCLQLQIAPALSPGFQQELEPGPLREVRENTIQPSLHVLRGSLCPLGPFLVCPEGHPGPV